jgi:hypothetical protein
MLPRYDFRQLGNVSCKDIAGAMAPLFLGQRALNTSFDSGRLHMPDWERFNGFSATPPLTAGFLADWPVSHHAYCDEWWVFEDPISRDFDVVALCNCIGTTITTYKELDFPGGCHFDSYLEKFRPLAVFGNNSHGYQIVDPTRITLPENFSLRANGKKPPL